MIRFPNLIVLALLLVATPASATEPLTQAEASAVVEMLRTRPEPALGSAMGMSSEQLVAALMLHARQESGQILRPASLNMLWTLTPVARDLEAEWTSARASGQVKDWLAGLSPADPRYQRLALARRDYAARVEAGGWPVLSTGAVLRPGDQSAAIIALRDRLALEGFLATPTQTPELYDEDLAQAVLRYQGLRGLEADALVGPATLAALSVSAAGRLAQIEANLERWRWLPRPLPATRIEADAGAARATLFVNGAPVLDMRIIVGAPATKTPMFASEIETVVLNPPWNVPSSIANAEILPRAARDSGYLARNNFTYQEGRLQQRPGPTNALGQVKFDMPSPLGIYLHDTPARAAFERHPRTLSHGCVRLERPRELAALLLGSQGWTQETVDGVIAQGLTRRVDLTAPVPVLIIYTTAFFDVAGLHLLADPYGWDAQLVAALNSRAVAQLDRDMASPESECASNLG